MYPEVSTGEHVTRQVLDWRPELMTVRFRFLAVGAEGALHSHPHVQSTYVQSGRFLFTVGPRQFQVGPGDAFVIPPDAVHGCRCLEPGVLIDGFAPARDDFLQEDKTC